MERLRANWIAAAAFGFAALFAGCRVFPEWQTVTLSFPDLPPAWLERGISPDWEIVGVWTGGSASAAIRSGEAVSLCLPRDETTAVLAYPTIEGRRLRPAGAVLPLRSVIDGELSLDWEGGYQAAAARALEKAGIDPACFDLERFLSEALERLSDPWTIPPDTFATAFAEEYFRVTWLNPPEKFSASAEGLPGPAASDSPFGESLVPDEAGRIAVELPAGVSRWYAEWGRLSVDVRTDGSATWIVIIEP